MSISRAFTTVALLLIFEAVTPMAFSQTTTPGDAIDVEIFNPVDGGNFICAGPGETVTVRTWVSPGTGTGSCSPSCGGPVTGGSSHLATGVVDISFDLTRLDLMGAANNPAPDFAAVDGLIQDNSGDGRVGWALAGDWTPDGNPSGVLADPCTMQLLSSAGWVMEAQLMVAADARGATRLNLRHDTDGIPFVLSFADICGSGPFTTSNGGIDEVVDATVLISPSCASILYFDGFESGDTSTWSSVAH